MRIIYWLIIIMDVTLIALLWIYIYDLYAQNRLGGLEYTSRLFHSDEAIPIIGLGVLLNTVALIFLIRSSSREKPSPETSRIAPLSRPQLENLSRQVEIDDLEKELGRIITRLEELKKTSAPGDEK